MISLSRTVHPWNITEENPDFTGIPPNILIMSEIKVFKREIEALKG